jgi:PAS domain S-box-containing protein
MMPPRLRILHLEDDASDAELVQLSLRAAGYDCEIVRVDTVIDFATALETLPPDLVLSDFALPSYDGASALQLVLARSPSTPFILVSGTLGEESAIDMLKNGATDYVLKTRMERLGPAVERALREARDRKARHAAEEAQRRLERAMEQAVDGIIVTDLQGCIEFVNGAFAEMHGYSREELLGRFHESIHTPEQMREEVGPFVEAVLEGGAHQGEVGHKHRSGATFPTETSLTLLRGPSGDPTGFVGAVRDIRERKRLERHQATQYAVTRLLAEASSMDEVVPRLLRVFCEGLGWEVAELWMIDAASGRLRRRVTWCLPGKEAANVPEAIPRGEGFLGSVWERAEPAWLSDPLPEAEVGSGFGFPLKLDNQVVGVFAAFSRDQRRRDAELDRVLADIAQRIELFVQRRLAEEALRESEARYRELYDEAPHAYLSLDTRGRIQMVNRRAGVLFGCAPEELLGTSLFGRVAGPGPLESALPILARFRAGEDIQESVQIRQADGGLLWVNMAVRPVRDAMNRIVAHLAIVVDIHERRLAEEKLSRSEARLELIFRSLPIALYTARPPPEVGTTWVSESAERLFGFPASRFVADPRLWESQLHPEDHERVFERLLTLAERGTMSVEYRLARADGSWGSFLDQAVLVKDSAGQPLEVVGTWLDVTAERRLEDELRQAQKMEAVGRLAGGVAHDFNNLLTTILINSDLCLDELPPTSELRAEIEDIKRAGSRGSALTRQLLAFSRRQVLQPRILDLNAVLTEVDKMLRRLIGEDLDFVTLPGKPLWRVLADPGHIEQVIMNLVVNARDAMPDGGKLTIETANLEIDAGALHEHVDRKPGEYVLLAVSDTGCGMDAATRARIFEPFFTTKPEGKGTGLGLSTVYGIVQQSAGFISVYSELGKGSTFKVYLPRADQPMEQELESARVRSSGGNETILLLEDDEGVRSLARRILEEKGYRILEASDGEQALRLAEKHEGPIHLLATDVVVPRLGGKQLAQQLREQRGEMKVLYMSGYADGSIIQHGVIDPRTPFLSKPFTAQSLARKVREVLDGEREPPRS